MSAALTDSFLQMIDHVAFTLTVNPNRQPSIAL